MSENTKIWSDYEKGIDMLNHILFCGHLTELKQLKEKMKTVLQDLKNSLKQSDQKDHKDIFLALIQDIYMTYQEKEKSLELKAREISSQKSIKWLALGMIVILAVVSFLTIRSFYKSETQAAVKEIKIPAIELPLKDRLLIVENKLQDLLKEREQILVFIQNLKKENEKMNNDLDKAKEKISYLEGLIREIRIERNFSR